ncbi:hypothetical protein AYK26_01810 [Euryarchaeota archaeon SM23-78]|nr:MAG: hypothetical protein AYK26_01810 [Euryarchaeota archaeon SM23-78]MBW3001403.1 hypothetical protein [Candidatus Woesearchaeota archaeon]
MSKKAQGLSMNVIIIAAIALLVLIILAVLILRAGRGVTEGTGCRGIGGRCYSTCQDLMDDEGGLWVKNLPNSGTAGGCAQDEECCVRLIEQPET